MKLTYDKQLRIAGIGLVPWTRLGPERWLPNYKIASLYGWDIHDPTAPAVSALYNTSAASRPAQLNSQSLIENSAFQNILRHDLAGYDFLTYKPVRPGPQLADLRFIASNQKLARQLENKAAFRGLLSGQNIPFPNYTIYDRTELQGMALGDILNGRESAVLQDDRLSGGKGTFVVRDEASLQHAFTSLNSMPGGRQVVVSDHIRPAYERSVQCCVTRHGIFIGPLQKQIVANPLLAHTDLPGSDMFCGAEITPSDSLAAVYPEIKGHALTIGRRMQELGYKGIFSLDCLVDGTGKVYVLEVNPRITGITPLVTMLYREEQDIPFYLLHVLELANVDYDITDRHVDSIGPEGSLMIVHDKSASAVQITETPSSGLYERSDLSFKQPSWRFGADEASTDVLVQQYVPPGVIKPGARVLNIFTRQRTLDDADKLSADTELLLASMRQKIKSSRV